MEVGFEKFYRDELIRNPGSRCFDQDAWISMYSKFLNENGMLTSSVRENLIGGAFVFLEKIKNQKIEEENSKVFGVSDWFVTLLILAIPLLNVVMYLCWAYGEGGNLNRKNFCRATIYLFLIATLLGLLISGLD